MRKLRKAQKILLVSILLAGILAALNATASNSLKKKKAEGYKTVISDLQAMIKTSPDLKNDLGKVLRMQDGRSYYWNKKDIGYFVKFFSKWLVYNPQPWAGPKYIQPFDELANSEGGEILFKNNLFASWFIQFLDARGDYLKTPQSLDGGILEGWQSFPDVHLSEFKPPHGKKTYDSFNDIFLREPRKPFKIDGKNNPSVVVSPASGKIRQIYAKTLDSKFYVKGDVINIRQALNNSPIADRFIGGKMVDILLWFTDYHHFHSPVSGEVVQVSEYGGSYNYDFQHVDWYKELAKHKRTCYIINTKKFGFVAMIPVGFWGVGSIITDPEIKKGYHITKGELIGNFGYGGSSILLIFEPGKVKFTLKDIGEDWLPVKPGTEIGVATVK